MKKLKTAKIIEKVALQEGMSIAKIRREMQIALDIAYENNTADSFWGKWRGKPTLEQFITAAADEVLRVLQRKFLDIFTKAD